jgi:hypothetical protein
MPLNAKGDGYITIRHLIIQTLRCPNVLSKRIVQTELCGFEFTQHPHFWL